MYADMNVIIIIIYHLRYNKCTEIKHLINITGKKNIIGDFLPRLNIKLSEEEDIQMRDVVFVVVNNIQFSEEKLQLYQKETI
jgi:hypothetical protein